MVDKSRGTNTWVTLVRGNMEYEGSIKNGNAIMLGTILDHNNIMELISEADNN